jgi:hypothetical protein
MKITLQKTNINDVEQWPFDVRSMLNEIVYTRNRFLSLEPILMSWNRTLLIDDFYDYLVSASCYTIPLGY